MSQRNNTLPLKDKKVFLSPKLPNDDVLLSMALFANVHGGRLF